MNQIEIKPHLWFKGTFVTLLALFALSFSLVDQAKAQSPYECARSYAPWTNINVEEEESCGTESNTQYGGLTNCAQNIPFVISNINPNRIHGKSEAHESSISDGGNTDVDDYYLNITDTLHIYWRMSTSHDIPYTISFFKVEESENHCSYPSASNCTQCSIDTSTVIGGKCGKTGFDYFTPGQYIVRVTGNYSGGLGCDQFHYYFELINIDAASLEFITTVDPNVSGYVLTPVQEHYNTIVATPDHSAYNGQGQGNCNNQNATSIIARRFTAVGSHSIITITSENHPNKDLAFQIGKWPMIRASSGCYDESGPGESEIRILETEPGDLILIGTYWTNNTSGISTEANVQVSEIPRTELRTLDCGLMNLTNSSIIRSNWPLNRANLSPYITKWRFKFEELEAPYNTYEVMSPNGYNPQFRMTWFPQRQAGRTYRVWTSVLMQPGPTWSEYGDPCIIGTASSLGMAALDEGPTFESELSEIQFTEIWPNPSNDFINVSIQTSLEQRRAEFRLFDLRGVEVDAWIEPLNGMGYSRSQRSVKDLAKGIYLLHSTTSIGTTVEKLFISK